MGRSNQAQWDLETGTAGIILALSRLGVNMHELAVELAENMCTTDLPEEGFCGDFLALHWLWLKRESLKSPWR